MKLIDALAELSSDVSGPVSAGLRRLKRVSYELVAGDEDDEPDLFLVGGAACACFLGVAVSCSGFDPSSIFPVDFSSSAHWNDDFLLDVEATLTALNSGPISSPETLAQSFEVAFDSARALQGWQLATYAAIPVRQSINAPAIWTLSVNADWNMCQWKNCSGFWPSAVHQHRLQFRIVPALQGTASQERLAVEDAESEAGSGGSLYGISEDDDDDDAF
eukprot:gnl/TRDRNA2_/TRDRNA2_170373_c0_seq1.p1 gnl/TRDRNA2_/TRDRNA2_170373_c0~~gnl/TRDRNA2_/TRDRNA2_170373_c0_seq1.p1  ORF type:complete len:218 (-),score=33.91 gnl/TRDRNA2_/TRDRNA2_170373_c0_seq1:48-701(-)